MGIIGSSGATGRARSRWTGAKFLVVGLIVGSAVAGSIAVASIPSSTSGQITACYKTSGTTKGAIRVIDAQSGAKCYSTEALLTWDSTRLTWRGAWSSTTRYVRGDIVVVDGSSYLARSSNTGSSPLTSSAWGMLAQAGAEGPQGPEGPQGEPGPGITHLNDLNGIGCDGPDGRSYYVRVTGADIECVTDEELPPQPIVFRGVDAMGSPNTQLFEINPDGSGRRQLTFFGPGVTDPEWSADGEEVVFTDYSGNLFIINGDGTGLRPVPTPAYASQPSWSPDGNRIVYFTIGGIWIINADGTDPRPLTDGFSDFYPSWSPDGTKIAFASNRDSSGFGYSEIYVMGADGSSPVRLTALGDTQVNLHPSWTADGRILYVTGGGDSTLGKGAYTMKPDGTDVQKIPNFVWVNDSNRIRQSPDGARYVFSQGIPNATQLFVQNTDGTGLSQISSGRRDDLADW